MKPGIIIATTINQADLTAVIDWGWERALVNGRRGWQSKDGTQSASFANSAKRLRGIEWGTPVYFAPPTGAIDCVEEIIEMIKSGRIVETEPVITELDV